MTSHQGVSTNNVTSINSSIQKNGIMSVFSFSDCFFIVKILIKLKIYHQGAEETSSNLKKIRNFICKNEFEERFLFPQIYVKQQHTQNYDCYYE
jgi:hypothetical protein